MTEYLLVHTASNISPSPLDQVTTIMEVAIKFFLLGEFGNHHGDLYEDDKFNVYVDTPSIYQQHPKSHISISIDFESVWKESIYGQIDFDVQAYKEGKEKEVIEDIEKKFNEWVKENLLGKFY